MKKLFKFKKKNIKGCFRYIYKNAIYFFASWYLFFFEKIWFEKLIIFIIKEFYINKCQISLGFSTECNFKYQKYFENLKYRILNGIANNSIRSLNLTSEISVFNFYKRVFLTKFSEIL